MPDGSDSKPPSIPAWQTTTSQNTSDTSSHSSKGDEEAVPAQERKTVLEQARLFLEEASVRDAPRERKAAFLEKKGLQSHEIQRLLGPSSSETASFARQDSDSSIPSSPASHSSAPPTSPSSSSTPPPQSDSQPSRDIPPIITYPEFLLRPTKPPPLVTLERLTYALYTFASISAFTYGASKYLVQPMLQSLTSSRHDLASTALHNLERLNEKLQGNVTHIPAPSHSRLSKSRVHDKDDNNDENASDIETVDSDPTELFHRDIGTQTSPRLLRSPSPSLSTSSLSRPASRGGGRGGGFGAGGKTAHAQQGALNAADLLAEPHRLVAGALFPASSPSSDILIVVVFVVTVCSSRAVEEAIVVVGVYAELQLVEVGLCVGDCGEEVGGLGMGGGGVEEGGQ